MALVLQYRNLTLSSSRVGIVGDGTGVSAFVLSLDSGCFGFAMPGSCISDFFTSTASCTIGGGSSPLSCTLRASMRRSPLSSVVLGDGFGSSDALPVVVRARLGLNVSPLRIVDR